MTHYLRVFLTILVATLCVPTAFWAQSKTPRPGDTSVREADGGGGTLIPKAPVTTDDDIAKLTAKKTSKPEATLVAKRVESPAVDRDKAQVELVALRQEIQEKQRKLELLMKMFVADEQTFIRNPGGESGDDDLAMKRRYEQAELRKQAVEIGQLRERLDVLTKLAGEKAVAATR